MLKLRKPTMYDFVQGLERGGRAFVAAAIGIYPAQMIVDNIDGASAIDTDLAKKAILTGCVAVIAFLWRWLLPDLGRSQPVLTANVPVTHHPHGSDVATDA